MQFSNVYLVFLQVPSLHLVFIWDLLVACLQSTQLLFATDQLSMICLLVIVCLHHQSLQFGTSGHHQLVQSLYLPCQHHDLVLVVYLLAIEVLSLFRQQRHILLKGHCLPIDLILVFICHRLLKFDNLSPQLYNLNGTVTHSGFWVSKLISCSLECILQLLIFLNNPLQFELILCYFAV